MRILDKTETLATIGDMTCKGGNLTYLLVVFVYISSLTQFTHFLSLFELVRVGRKPLETDSIKFKISSKTPRGEKDSTKRHHHRHHKRQPGEQQFPKQVVTG